MIYLRHGKRTEGRLTVPIHNFHLLSLHFSDPSSPLVMCLRCGASGAVTTISATFGEDCPKRDAP